jgi:hypothetical protein
MRVVTVRGQLIAKAKKKDKMMEGENMTKQCISPNPKSSIPGRCKM